MWLPVVGNEGEYEISDEGHCRSLDRTIVTAAYTKFFPGQLLSPQIGTKGYPYVNLPIIREDGTRHGRRIKRRIHLMVLESFVGLRPAGLHGLHRDGNPANCSLGNLYWGTPTQNSLDAVTHGTHPMSRKTRCKQDHPFSGSNLEIRGGQRVCRTCRLKRQREYDARRRSH